MAGDHPEADGKQRRHRRRHHSDRHERQTQPQPDDDEYGPPADVAALREARLRSMATPVTARKKMKVEYQKTRLARAVRPKSVKTSTGIFGRRSSVLPVRSKSVVEEKKMENHEEDDGDYVYRRSDTSMVSRRDFQEEHEKEVKEQRKAPIERRKTSSTVAEKPKVERRKTEPPPTLRRSSTTATKKATPRKSSTGVKVTEVNSGIDQPVRKRRKSTTSTSVPEAASADGLTSDNAQASTSAAQSKMSAKPMRPETVVSTAKTTKSDRTSSVFGSLFKAPPPPREKLVPCLTCGSDDIPVSRSAKLSCSHRMCHSCLKRIFKMSIKDPAHMPPRCCTDDDIALKHVETLFSDEFKKTWNRKYKEYNAKNRVYCSRKGCGEWIQPKHMRIEAGRKIGICPKCKHAVCAICNQKAHKSKECPKDPAMKQFYEAAEQSGWRTCYNCKAMVELKEGCNHMTCRCQAEFCMVCGLKWKSCDCPWFNYEVVGNLRGDPVRYQQEMDRRREQMQRDEEMARQLAGLGLGNGPRRVAEQIAHLEGGNGNQPVNANFWQQARDALAGPWQNGDQAARGLLGGWLNGQDNALPGMPGAFDQQTRGLQQRYPPTFENTPAGRRAYRVRNAALE